MSVRTLIEINHDYGREINSVGFLDAIAVYVRSGSREDAEELERFGVRVLGTRHHSTPYTLDGTPDGFPPQYLERAKKTA